MQHAELVSLVQMILTNVESVEKRWQQKVMKNIVDAVVAIATKFITSESYSD